MKTKEQKAWDAKRKAWLNKVSKAELVSAVIAAWDLMENHNCVTGKGFNANGEALTRDDYAVIFPSDVSKVIEGLVPSYWERK